MNLKTTEYFRYIRTKPDRARILEEWIQAAVEHPIREQRQSDGRIRRWTFAESEGRYLRVILLGDGETVHNAFFGSQFQTMNIKYFRDTDTALFEFSNRPIDETREISENIYIDLDKAGNLVSMTIEHAQQTANLPRVVVEEIQQDVA